MKRIMMTVAYDGTNYHGWQIQPGKITVEGVLNRQLSDLLGEEIRVIGGSRTDSGVHALCNVAVFDTGARIPGEKISYALNRKLPEDIRIRGSEEVPGDFHPRRRESRKTYEYRIWNSRFPLPTRRLYTTFIHTRLDADRMRQAAAFLVGEHDFKSFCNVRTQAETTVRTIYDLRVAREGEEIVFTIAGNGFLYNMVRIIAGTLIEIGAGRMEPERMEMILAAGDRTMAGPTAPPEGLTLKDYVFTAAPPSGQPFSSPPSACT